MSREEFLTKLKKHLKRLPQEEIESALSYYAEYLDDVGVENEASTIAALGNPYKIAAQITAEYAVKDMQAAPSAKKVFSTGWVVLLSIFASPVAAALACVAIALVFVVFFLILSLAIAAISLVGCGIVCIAVGICLIVQNFAVTLFYIGAGLFVLGAGVMFILATIKLSKKVVNSIANMISKCLPRRDTK